MAEVTPKTAKSHCNCCLGETNHDILAEHTREWDEEDKWGNLMYVERQINQLVQCRGCENISLRRICTASGEENTIYCFPPSASRKLPIWLSGWFPYSVTDNQVDIAYLFHEVYSAIHSGSYRLAMMGTRAIVDLALTDKLGDIGGFEKKLKAARDHGWITEIHSKTLKAAIDAGSAASHRAYKPDKNQLNLVLDIVESFINPFVCDRGKCGRDRQDDPSSSKKGRTP